MKQGKVFIYGKHAVEEALFYAPRSLTKLYVDARVVDKKLLAQIQKSGIPTGPLMQGAQRSDMTRGTAHQGIIGQLSLHELVLPYEKFIEELSVTPSTSLVVLSGIQDPHNVGAIIRSAAGFGGSAVLMPQKNQSPVTGTVIKVSAGMAFRIPLVQVQDVAHTIEDLKKRGFKAYAFAGKARRALQDEEFSAPSAFVFGNEGEGIPHDVRKLCDETLSIPMHERTESLNVAASAAVALYAWSAQHKEALQ